MTATAPATPGDLAARLRDAARPHTYRRIGLATGVHPHTARRYLDGDRPSVEFLAAFCRQFDVSADWLLTGRGQRNWSGMRSWARQTCTSGDLCRLLGDVLDSAEARAEALESRFRPPVGTRLRTQEA